MFTVHRGMVKVVIIDPIFRGSRLFYTQMVSTLGDEITILTRTDARTEASDEAFAGVEIELREVVTTAKDSWYYHLDETQLSELEEGLRAVLDRGAPDLLFMAGLDELAVGIAGILRRLAPSLSGSSVFGVHYTPSVAARQKIGPITIPVSLRRFLPAGRFSRLVREFVALRAVLPSLRLGLLDERISTKVRPPELFMLLPDPPPPSPEPSESLLDLARSEGGSPTLLLVGRQSQRKGFEDIRGLIETRPECLPAGTKIVLCGRLEKDTEQHRSFIEASTPLILHADRYLSDTEIRARYETADYVLLPYTTAFQGSSGVLASAAAAGTPVIVSDHGLIAHRVRESGLGFTYPSGNIAALADIFKQLPATHSQEYGEIRQRCLNFAERNSITRFCDRLQMTIESDYE